MTWYVAFLRGINVGGNKMVAMAELREMLTAMGFADAKTLLQSGNAVFRAAATPTASLEARLEAEAKKRLGVTCDFHVRTVGELRAAIDGNPLKAEAKKDPSRMLLILYKQPLGHAVVDAAQAAITGPEVIRCDGRHLYMYFPDGQGNSKASVIVSRILKVHGTGRNWNTVLKLAALTTGT
ncbi:MAG TPA: DUF1697 domain-containing protein [Vicinamibacterales bacterium]|jgi:uncharacterized protein (DUF1697 family)